MAHSLKRFHLKALIGIGICMLVVAMASYRLLVEPNSTPSVSATESNQTIDTPHPAPSTSRRIYAALIFLGLSGIAGLSLWIYIATIPTVRHDIYTLVRMFKDVRQGSVRVAYPVMLNEFAVAQRYLRGWSEEMLAEKEKLKDMGMLDHLSQLSNRRHFEMRLKELFDTARTHGPSSVLIIDADHFKQVNDRHGHDTGDALIVKFAALLRANVRHTDMLARLGGDEFCIIYTYVPLKSASDLAARLRRALPREVELKPGVQHTLRWTGGLSCIYDADSRPDDVLWRADQALLRAKEAGRNRTMIYGSGDATPGNSST